MSRGCVSILLFMSLALSSYAQESQLKENQISVLGAVELKEVADQASFTFSVKGVGETLRLAVEDANAKVKAVTDKLLKLGVPSSKIATSQFYSGENYGDKSFWSSKRDYQAVLTTLVTVDSIGLVESVLFALSEGEISNVSNVSFGLKDELGMRRKARIAATLKAKEKAQDITGALGVTLGRVLSIEETKPTRVIQPQAQQVRRFGYVPIDYNVSSPFNPSSVVTLSGELPQVDESSGSGIFAQTISVTSEVTVIFEIKN